MTEPTATPLSRAGLAEIDMTMADTVATLDKGASNPLALTVLRAAALLRAEVGRLTGHSTVLSTVSYRMAEALGDVAGGQPVTASPEEQVDRLLAELTRLRAASSATPAGGPIYWDGHRLLGQAAPHCAKDLASPGPDEDPQAWFASHLAECGLPDYVVAFERDWRGDVGDDRSGLDVDKVARELSDYGVVMHEVSTVYDEVTNGRFSKPNTAAAYITEAVREGSAEDYADFLCEAIETLPEIGDSAAWRAELIDLANDWSEGAWERHLTRRQQVAARAALDANPTAGNVAEGAES